MEEQISLVPPRTSVEIQLPDGRVLSGPRGAKVGEFLETLEYDAQSIAAINCASYSSVSRNSPTFAPRGPDKTRPSGNWISTEVRGGTRLICSSIFFFQLYAKA